MTTPRITRLKIFSYDGNNADHSLKPFRAEVFTRNWKPPMAAAYLKQANRFTRKGGNMYNVILRKACMADISDIMEIESESFEPGIAESRDVFIERITTFNEGFLVLEDLNINKCIGYIASELWRYSEIINNDSFALGHSIKSRHCDNGNEIYISSTGTLSSYRKHGLGGFMFDELLKILRNKRTDITSAILIVSTEWIAAKKIYLKNNFYEICCIESFFRPINGTPSDGVVMRKIFD